MPSCCTPSSQTKRSRTRWPVCAEEQSRPAATPPSVRVWSVLATVGDHIDEAARLKKTVGRLASYLRGYGDVLVAANGWDPGGTGEVPRRPVRPGLPWCFDAKASTGDLEYLATLSRTNGWPLRQPAHLNNAARRSSGNSSLGADSVILHGATPSELAPILPAYRAARPAGRPTMPANPGRNPS